MKRHDSIIHIISFFPLVFEDFLFHGLLILLTLSRIITEALLFKSMSITLGNGPRAA